MNIFTINRSEIEERLDPFFYNNKPDFSQYIKLSKIATVKGGKRIPLGKTYSDIPTDYLYLRVADMVDDTADYNSLKSIDSEVYSILKSYEVVEGDIALSIAGSIGKVLCIRNIPSSKKVILTENCAKILVKKDIVLPEYMTLLLSLDAIQKQIDLNYIQTTIPKLGLDRIRNIYIPKVPNFKKQQEIVTFYERTKEHANQKSKESEKLLAGIDAYLLNKLGIKLPQKDNSLSKRMCTLKFSDIAGRRLDPLYYMSLSNLKSELYPKIKLSEICKSFNSGFGAGKGDQTSNEKGIIQIRPTNIDSDCELKFDKNVYIDNNSDGKRIMKNDVLFNNTNSQELVGKTAIGEFAENMFYSNHITVISVREDKLDPYFLKEHLNMLQRHKFFYAICTNWNNQSGIGIELLRNIKIYLPPLEKQKEIAEHIKQIRSDAKKLQSESEQILSYAKQQVEKMILGE